MAIHFYSNSVTPRLTKRRVLKRFLTDVAEREGYKLKGLTYIFCTDDYLLDINKRFLNHDTLTDIITFPLVDDDNLIESEIYISVERVIVNAVKFKCSERDELLRVMFHGLLHMCGYSDKTKEEKVLMRNKENYYLKEYNSY